MAPICELEPLTSRQVCDWDTLIAPCKERELFHCRAWLDYLAASRGVDIRRWAICEGGRTRGYFCGGIVRKGPFSILGSPLKGWGTNFMGPVWTDSISQPDLLDALDGVAKSEHLAMIEMEYRSQSAVDVRTAGYEPVPTRTFLVNLHPDPDAMWMALNPTCRNRIRKAMKAGLTIEVAEDLCVAQEFYDQYSDLMRRKGLGVPYPPEVPILLFKHLKPAGLLLPLRVRDQSGRVLATGLFPHDDRTMYFWGGASWQAGRDLCPNEFLHWSAIRLAAERGVARYDMCGNGQFKEKFGGTLVELRRWHKFYWQTARWARQAYELYFLERQRLAGWWRSLPRVWRD